RIAEHPTTDRSFERQGLLHRRATRERKGPARSGRSLFTREVRRIRQDARLLVVIDRHRLFPRLSRQSASHLTRRNQPVHHDLYSGQIAHRARADLGAGAAASEAHAGGSYWAVRDGFSICHLTFFIWHLASGSFD